MRRLMLIINPAAGRGAYEDDIGEALRVLYTGGCVPTVFFTAGAGDATRFVAEHAREYDLVCCVGGDGTLSQTVSGLMTLSDPPPIGYFPLGTTNDVATTLGLPKNDLPAAAQAILDGESVAFDVGAFGQDMYFTYVAAFGAFTDVSYETSQQQKQALGHLAYLLEGMTRLPRIVSYNARYSLDGGPEQTDRVIFGGVMNSTSVAGLVRLDPKRVHLDDGLFEVVLVRAPHSLAELNQLLSEARNPDSTGQFLSIHQASQVTFRFDEPVAWTCDGESGGSYTELELKNKVRAIRFLV